MADTKLYLSGKSELVVRMALQTYRGELKKAKKRDEALGASSEPLDELDGIAKDLLKQLGFTDEGAGRAEVVRDDDDRQLALPMDQRVICGACNGARYIEEMMCARCHASGFEPAAENEPVNSDVRCTQCLSGWVAQVARDCELPCPVCGHLKGFRYLADGSGVEVYEPASKEPALKNIRCGACNLYFQAAAIAGPVQCHHCLASWEIMLDDAGAIVRMKRVADGEGPAGGTDEILHPVFEDEAAQDPGEDPPAGDAGDAADPDEREEEEGPGNE